jgi:RimJ/RimL family protein N-acetyltransferase
MRHGGTPSGKFCTKLNRVHAEADPQNVRSVASLERMGFSKEGVLRDSCIVNGVVADAALYGLLQREWKNRVAGAVR